MTAGFAVRYAARGLLRGGQRSLLATACVACGVMALVALQLLAGMIAASVAVDGRQTLGGDALLARGGGALAAADVAVLERLRANGAIAAYSLTAESPGAVVKRRGAGRARLLGRALGVDPATYPLAGALRLRRAGPALAGVLALPGAAVVTRDVADDMGLREGDELVIAGDTLGAPARLRVAAIAELTPDRQGDTVIYSLATARRIAGRQEVAGAAQVRWGAAAPLLAALRAAGWSVTAPADVARRRARVAGLFGTMLQGAGVLGLLLGGLGVASTMQVLLARRRLEIATLKTLGYERRHLALLLGLEAAMLGAAGGVVGAAAGGLLAVWLRALLAGMGPILLGPAIAPWTLAGGVAVGVATAVIFGLQAIARAAGVRPATLLRDLPAPRAWRETAALHAALGALFAALAAAVLHSAVYGVAVAAAGLAGLALLMAPLGAGLFAVAALPLPRLPVVVEHARRNLRRQAPRSLVALVALFCGVSTIGFAGATIASGRARFTSSATTGGEASPNLAIWAAPADAARLTAAAAGGPAGCGLCGPGIAVRRRGGGPGGLVKLVVTVDPRQLDAVAERVAQAAPEALVVSAADARRARERALGSLFGFVVAVAGLAVAAGCVLIANTVGLAVLERRREIGIWKAIGASSARILAGIAVEQALLGLVAGVAGVGAVAAACGVVDRWRPAARLALRPGQAPAMIAVATGVALASALLVAWRPTHARPQACLRLE